MVNNSATGDAVYEPFCGGGSTIIAAETTGRICLARDIDARYVDVGVRRWQALTGRAAVLAAEDRSFNDVSNHGKRVATTQGTQGCSQPCRRTCQVPQSRRRPMMSR
jgi:hypothetical protein